MPRKKKEKPEGAVEEKKDQDKMVQVQTSEAVKPEVPKIDKEALKKRIAEKASEMAEKIRIIGPKVSVSKLKPEEKVSEEALEEAGKPKGDLLVPLEEYVKSGIHLGTKVITEHMRAYVFKRRADGLAIFNTNVINEKIKLAAAMLANYSPRKIVAAGKREASWKALSAFGKATGIRVFTKKYPAGIITNSNLEDFFEPELMFVVDPWLDKNPISDALLTNIPLVALCDTNNMLSNADLIIPCNNKSNKSIGLIFWILAREYNKIRKIDNELPALEDFTGE